MKATIYPNTNQPQRHQRGHKQIDVRSDGDTLQHTQGNRPLRQGQARRLSGICNTSRMSSYYAMEVREEMKTIEPTTVPRVSQSEPLSKADVTQLGAELLRQWLEQAWEEAERESERRSEAPQRVSERARFHLD